MDDRQLRSVCNTTLPTLRCTNRSPGSMPTISLAGTRASEQPIHKYSGSCCFASFSKNEGSSSLIDSAQRALLSNSSCNSGIGSSASSCYRLNIRGGTKPKPEQSHFFHAC